ncbi:response regulator [Pedobacter duraquae]|uniref:Response regulator receiver domain-containing protein n=1 Tax=Pedobacter duraquae TaxID=425511 RepID=A0A4V6PSC1_9SPHI|nr:response regulator [Pedobacter duraquae]TDO20229.1 response regulator receiver domain-containing protein [Pedobacter duraquae]
MKKILVVEDNEVILQMITLLLELEGYTVVPLAEGCALKTVIENVYPDVILMDVLLGDMDGRLLCSAIKKDPITATIPVILMSAGDECQLAQMEQQCLPNDFLAKPFDISCLVQKVKRQLIKIQ